MNLTEIKILNLFKSLLSEKLSVYKMILFGSRARGDASEDSDMDIVVILNKTLTDTDLDYVSSCAWEAGFKKGVVIVPVVFSRDEWENSPERYSLLSKAVTVEGTAI